MKATTVRLEVPDYNKILQRQLANVDENGNKPHLTKIAKDIIKDLKPENYTKPPGPLPRDKMYLRLYIGDDNSELIKAWRHAGIDLNVPYTYLIRNAIVSSLESS